jgi:exodeoxyribonuclease V beta subunit
MTAFSDFDPREPLGDGRTVIEASAGTGKTFTISALVTRLIAEEGVKLDEILVVTFTVAATAELRSRVRKRIVETLRALETVPPVSPPTKNGKSPVLVSPPSGGKVPPAGRPGVGGQSVDEHLAALLAADASAQQLAIARLQEALTHFDRAQIFTIHGFAQRLLGQLGLRARLSPDLEPGEPDELLLKQTASDLIVGRYADNNEEQPPASHHVIEIARAVVGTPDARIVPEPADVAGETLARVELAHALRLEVQRRMRAGGLVTFDDGLIEVRDTLSDPEVGVAARELLARRYSVALVDESQDTDPIQWQVIRAVFDESRLVVIGDPKQSIYSFRGADVESYLAALAGADALRTLRTNWRSDGPLITALDALFAGATFGDDLIGYHPVEPAPGHRNARIDGISASLAIRCLGDIGLRTKKSGNYYVGEARQAVAADVAAEIVQMLTTGVAIDGEHGPEPLRPDHIAVLCRTRRQVDMVRAELTLRAVPSVAARTGGVFVSGAAEEWRRFLHGVESPERMGLVKLAASSLLLGYSPHEIAALSDEQALELQRRTQDWREILYSEGVPALVGEVDRSFGLTRRVLALADGERIMTDLTHIAEEMHSAWRRRRTGSLVGWLETAMAEAQQREDNYVEEPESRQRRLETDAAAVQVQTIHAAKGLQWPVVMVPYAWDVPLHRSPIPVFHPEETTTPGEPRERLVDVGGSESPDYDAHVALAVAEDAAEEGRLLYVALTRAEHHLKVWWIENTDYTANSKLNELIVGSGRSPQELVTQSAGNLEMTTVDRLPRAIEYRTSAAEQMALERARLERRLDYDWRRASFSSLSPEHPIGAAAETTEQPLRSDEADLGAESEELPPAGESTLLMANLPRGARFGTLVHHVFEEVPFDAPDLDAAIREALQPELAYSNWDLDLDALVSGLVAAMETPLGPAADTPRLRDLNPKQVFDELTFELPVRTDAGTVSLRDIGNVMLDHLPQGDPYRRYAETLQGLPGSRFRGFLTGAIDLTALVPGPEGDRYVVMDYKSNALPMRGEAASPLDYGPEQLATAMIDGNYVLQATLYQVALHRYLQWRLRGFDPAQHLGGSLYLFVRGMAGAEAPVADGERCGVARWHPPVEMITELSRLFAGGER